MIMKQPGSLPQSFLDELKSLEGAYLTETDPIRQSGFSGGPDRWRTEREPILNAVDCDGDFLDIGCANGYLLECLVAWGRERGINLMPHGIDQGSRLIELAKKRFPELQSNFHAANAWDWVPPRRYRYVYTLYDCVPQDYLGEYVHRVLVRMVAYDGRLIIGAYGSRSRGLPPFEVDDFLRSEGFAVAGTAMGGYPPVALFAWIDKQR